MKNIDLELELIDKYLDGQVSAEEKSTVEQKIKEDPAFAQLFNKTKAAVQVIQQQAEEDTMNLLSQIYQEEKAQGILSEDSSSGPALKEGKIIKMKPRQWLTIAASICLLAVAAIWVFSNDSQSDLFSDYYETPTFDLQRGGEQSTQLNEITSAYNQGDFQKALGLIQEFSQANEAPVSLLIYQGVCHLELGELAAAETLFSNLSQQGQELDQIMWLQALTQIRQENTEGAKQTLNRMLDGTIQLTPKRKERIQKLIREID